jgi:glycosyltransferase involved in cell wall biosynthesis
MFDKTLFEAAACGALPIASSEDWRALVGEEFFADANPESLAERILATISLEASDKVRLKEKTLQQAQLHALPVLVERLTQQLAEEGTRGYTNPA